MTNILYVYGTLRPGEPGTVQVPGKLYDLGWYPGLILGGDETVTCEKVNVKDFQAVDHYEGFNPDDTVESLYIRKKYEDGWIYEYNQEFNPNKLIECGDWLIYKQTERGKYDDRFT